MKTKEQKKDAYLLSSVNNSLKILELLMVRDDIRLKDISQLLQLDQTSVFKMLYTLERRGFVIKDKHARYQLGNKLAPCKQLSVNRQNIVDLSTPTIFQLWAKTQKTVMLGMLGVDDRLVIASMKAEKDQDSIVGRIGAGMDFHTTGMGKILLAFMDQELSDSLIERSTLKKMTEHTVTDKDELRSALAECRKNRWAAAFEENHAGHCDLAAPVFDYSGVCVAALCLVTDPFSLNSYFPFYLRELQDAVHQISERLGYSTYQEKP